MRILFQIAAALALIVTTTPSFAGDWVKTRMNPVWDYSYDTSLPAFEYQSDKWLPYEFATLSVLVPREMPGWTRAIRPSRTSDHAKFYAGIVPEIRRSAIPEGEMLEILKYCYEKVGEQDVAMGECLYLTSQANMTVQLDFALDASGNGKFNYAQPVLYNSSSDTYRTMRRANELDEDNWKQHFFNRLDITANERFHASIRCNFKLGDPDSQRWNFSTRGCNNSRSDAAASAAFGRLNFTVTSLKEYRENYDAIGIRFSGANEKSRIISIPLKSVADAIAPWMN